MPHKEEYRVGQRVVLVAEFRNRSEVLFDPTAPITVRCMRPDETLATVSSQTNPSVGRMEAKVTVDAPGHWYYVWEAENGTDPIVSEDSFIVRAVRVPA